MRRAVFLALAGACLVGSVCGDVIYQYDDGIQDSAAGEGLDWDFYWLNRFGRQAGGEVITDLYIFFDYEMPTGAAFRAVLWNDSGSNGNPVDARVATFVETVATGSGSRWVAVDIPDTPVTPYFFVGAYIGSGVSITPAGINVPGWAPERGYFGGSDTGSSDLNNLPGNTEAGWYEDFGYEYVNMIGATGIAAQAADVPEPASMTLLALGGLALLRRTRRKA